MVPATQYQASVESDVVGGGTSVVALNGDFDMSNSYEFERRLSEAFGPERTDIVVDLRGVRFLDSTMLGALLRGLTRANQEGVGFALIRPNAFVWRVFVLTRLSEHFSNYSSLHEALSER